ncbi:hypothetical protein WDW89_12635 [Deltaproteobacteria bacterium TL4]
MTSPQDPSQTTVSSLNSQISELLQQITVPLDLLHSLPFEHPWLKESLGRALTDILKEMEALLLYCWKRLQTHTVERLQQEIEVWYVTQKRSPAGILQQYYQFHEDLLNWCMKPEITGLCLENTWCDYVFYQTLHTPHLLKRLIPYPAHYDLVELLLIAENHLDVMQKISSVELYWLCFEFFQFLSVFTQDSVFLPFLHWKKETGNTDDPSVSLKIHELYQQFKTASNWRQCVEFYLDVLQHV